MKKSKLINFTTQDFVSEKELELKLYRWEKVKDKYIPKLKASGLLRVVTTKIWNKEGISRLGHLFEYEDEKAYRACQEIIEKKIMPKAKVSYNSKIRNNRGIIFYDYRS